jgi:hypothetical protein
MDIEHGWFFTLLGLVQGARGHAVGKQPKPGTPRGGQSPLPETDTRHWNFSQLAGGAGHCICTAVRFGAP